MLKYYKQYVGKGKAYPTINLLINDMIKSFREGWFLWCSDISFENNLLKVTPVMSLGPIYVSLSFCKDKIDDYINRYYPDIVNGHFPCRDLDGMLQYIVFDTKKFASIYQDLEECWASDIGAYNNYWDFIKDLIRCNQSRLHYYEYTDNGFIISSLYNDVEISESKLTIAFSRLGDDIRKRIIEGYRKEGDLQDLLDKCLEEIDGKDGKNI